MWVTLKEFVCGGETYQFGKEISRGDVAAGEIDRLILESYVAAVIPRTKDIPPKRAGREKLK